ncbi:MAG: hypothetical protein U0V87_04960 [Acidobacteriota bacterium]
MTLRPSVTPISWPPRCNSAKPMCGWSIPGWTSGAFSIRNSACRSSTRAMVRATRWRALSRGHHADQSPAFTRSTVAPMFARIAQPRRHLVGQGSVRCSGKKAGRHVPRQLPAVRRVVTPDVIAAGPKADWAWYKAVQPPRRRSSRHFS